MIPFPVIKYGNGGQIKNFNGFIEFSVSFKKFLLHANSFKSAKFTVLISNFSNKESFHLIERLAVPGSEVCLSVGSKCEVSITRVDLFT